MFICGTRKECLLNNTRKKEEKTSSTFIGSRSESYGIAAMHGEIEI